MFIHLFIQSILEGLAGCETNTIRCLDLHFFTGLWVTSHPCRTRTRDEATETNEVYFVSISDRLLIVVDGWVREWNFSKIGSDQI